MISTTNNQIDSKAGMITTSAWFIEGAVTTDGLTQRVSIPMGRFQVGRRADANMCLANPSVSKNHAEFVATEVALFVRDLGSTNGTFVNGERITQDTPIGTHDIVQFADFEFIVGRTSIQGSSLTALCSPSQWQSTLAQFHKLLTSRSVVPHFQPIIRFSDDQTIGYELLARSTHAGLTNPREMFDAAEKIGLAARLSVICRETGVEIANKLAKPGLLFLNTHPSEKPHVGLLESLIQLRMRAPDLGIVLELHESAVTNPKEMAEFRDELRNLRIQLAYDDFGAGQARLLELAEVAPDFLKFDIGLVHDIHLAPQRQQMVAGLVRTIRELGIQPLAEGIELTAEAEVCRQIGFTHAQGFLFGRPVPAESM